MTDGSARMLSLLSLLQARREWPAAELAGRLGVSTRTIRRDVERLRELGYRVSAAMGPDGGYRLAAGEELPPLRFDDEQAVAIAIALSAVGGTGAAIEEDAERALATVRQVLPSRLRHRVDGLRFANGPSGVRTDPEVILAVSAAVREGRVLRFDYRGSGSGSGGGSGSGSGSGGGGGAGLAADGAPPRRVEPHELVARDGRWYLVAFDLEREEWRVYRLDRMAPRTPHGARFAARRIPGGDALAFLAGRFRGAAEGAGDAWPCIGEVLVRAEAAELAPWLEAGELVEAGDGRCRLALGSWSWAGVAARLLQFERPFELLGPPELLAAAEAAGGRLSSAGRASPGTRTRRGGR
ncbi:WYL domain-containing protein [Agromyces mediolanus]|uniref:helix-turn-helix transcriptional regulator n=1 Tax=Agromyces mediolanus TaxID=41986 RepID=UPI00383946BF